MKRLLPALLTVLSLTAVLPAAAQEARVIVSFKSDAAALREHPMSAGTAADGVAQMAQRRADRLAPRAGRSLLAGRAFGARLQVLKASGIDSATLAARLAAHPEVEYAVVDRRRRATRTPGDPLFSSGPASGLGPASGQWYLRAPTATVASAINAQAAWDRVTGSASIVVAVLDTGVLSSHTDLAGVVLSGYDMIHDSASAGDGNGRDSDATDAGDFVTAAEAQLLDCDVQNSSWHGTKVSGIIGAAADNGLGIAGTAFGVRILPVRVLGKCGGYDSDIVAGMYWAVGFDQPGLPGSSTRARVLNLSLGADGACDGAYPAAVREVTARNAVIVAAAGNSAGLAVGSPGNCQGVIAVVGLRHAGSKVGFSNIGPEVTISAPGGNCVNTGAGEPCLYPIATTSNSGTRTAVAAGSVWTDSFAYSVGTSFAAPQVAGAVALMLSANPALTPSQIATLLRRSARPFPSTGADNGTDPTPVAQCRMPDGIEQLQCYCSTAVCGAGMLDAAAAVQGVMAPASLEEVARQLLNFGEQNYPQYFRERPATLSSPPFLYRYYPGTGIHLGVVVQPGMGYVLDGVYVMGGPFAPTPQFVGMLTDFITPITALP